MARSSTPRALNPGGSKDESIDSKGAATAESKLESKKEVKQGRLLKIVAVVASFVILCVMYQYLGSVVDVKGMMEKAVDFVEKQGNSAIWWYCFFVFLWVIFLLPSTPIELAGGFLLSEQYGLWVYVITGCAKCLANIISVLIARFLVKDLVLEKVVKKSELLQMVALAVKDEPWKMAFLVRGSMVPLCVKNYGLGVTEIGYLPIACWSMVFTNFYAAQNIYMGSTMKNLKDVFAPKVAHEGPKPWTSYLKTLMPIIFNVMLVVFLIKAVKAQLKKQRVEIEKKLKKKQEKQETQEKQEKQEKQE